MQEDGRVSVARHQEVDAVRKWREAQEALESERHKRETLDVEVRKLRAQVQNLEVVAGDLEVECKLREAQVAEQSELSQKLLALQQENDALKAAAAVPESVRAGSPREASAQEVQAGPQLQECMETVADAGPDEQSVRPPLVQNGSIVACVRLMTPWQAGTIVALDCGACEAVLMVRPSAHSGTRRFVMWFMQRLYAAWHGIGIGGEHILELIYRCVAPCCACVLGWADVLV